MYNAERDAFVVEQAGWVDGEPQIEYRFTYFSADEDDEIARTGGLDKWWLNEDGFAEGAFFAFGEYPDQAAFDDAVKGILKAAEQHAHDNNPDFFLAGIDIIKEQAVEVELDDELIFDFAASLPVGSFARSR